MPARRHSGSRRRRPLVSSVEAAVKSSRDGPVLGPAAGARSAQRQAASSLERRPCSAELAPGGTLAAASVLLRARSSTPQAPETLPQLGFQTPSTYWPFPVPSAQARNWSLRSFETCRHSQPVRPWLFSSSRTVAGLETFKYSGSQHKNLAGHQL